MNFNCDADVLNDFTLTRNLKNSTKKSYKTTLNLYADFNNAPFIDLLKEAEQEESNGIRWKYRRLKERLLKFRNFLSANYRKNYARITFSRIITLYRHYDIEIHALPSQSRKNYIESPPITFGDLPDKNIIRKALRRSDIKMKAITLFMLSSGCARRDTLNLTINDFITATSQYHNEDDISTVINILSKKRKVVPTFKLKRQKTGKYYYTFITPEATRMILNYLKTRNNLKSSNKLFEIHRETLSRKFIKINNQLGLGKSGTYNRYRSHNLRKFHASSLRNSGMLMEDINSIQGKSKTPTDEAYYFENPDVLKQRYVKHMNALIIYNKNKVKEAQIPVRDNVDVFNINT